MMRKPTALKVPLSKRTTTTTTITAKTIDNSKTVPLKTGSTKPETKTTKSTVVLPCPLPQPPSPTDNAVRYDSKVSRLQDESLTEDGLQLSGDNLNKSGDTFLSVSLQQEHMETTKKLMADLEVERSERKRLECYSQRLKTQMQTLQLRMDSKRPSAGCKPLPPTPSPLTQRAVNVLACGRTDHRSAVRLRTDVASVTAVTENSGGGGGQTAMGDLLADELGLKNGDRQLEAKCMALESETVHLRAEASRTAVRIEKLERENVDLKFELDNEMRLHSEEIAKLSEQTHLSSKKFEKLENENAELVRKLAEAVKTRCEEVERWANKTREAIAQRNEVMAARTSQHDLVTQQLMDIQRKENFIGTIKDENESLYRKNKALELKIELLEKEAKTAADGGQRRGAMSRDERPEFQARFERLREEFENTKDAYQNLLAVREEEIKMSKKTTKDKEEEFRHNFNEQTRRFTGEIEKLKDIIANNAKENSSLQKKNENLIKKLEYYHYTDNDHDDRSIDISSIDYEDEKYTTVKYIN